MRHPSRSIAQAPLERRGAQVGSLRAVGVGPGQETFAVVLNHQTFDPIGQRLQIGRDGTPEQAEDFIEAGS